MKFQAPKGTEDFYPEEMSIRQAVFGSLRSTAEKFGFREISSPAFENIGLLTKKEGEEIKQQIFTLEKRSNEEFALRFDLTVPITRMFIEKQKTLTKPVKWFAIDRMWRYEQPQKGRLREFYQLSVELFGADSIYADAEIILLAIKCLTDLGLKQGDFYLKLNSRKLLQALLLEIITQDQLESALRIIDKKNKISKDAFNDELKKAGIVEYEKINSLLSMRLEDIRAENKQVSDALSEIKSLFALLGDSIGFVKFDLSTARGLAYYTGIVFEAFDSEGKFRAILGGGRYDNLVSQFEGEKTPATGFGLGYATLSLLLQDKGLAPKPLSGIDYYIAPMSEKEMNFSLNIAAKLRNNYSVEIDLQQRNLGNQLKYANKIGAKKLIVIGENEISTGKFLIKDMQTGKQEILSLNDL